MLAATLSALAGRAPIHVLLEGTWPQEFLAAPYIGPVAETSNGRGNNLSEEFVGYLVDEGVHDVWHRAADRGSSD